MPPFTPEDQGTLSFTATLKTAGTQSITATDTGNSGIAGSESGIIVQAAAASSLVLTGFPTTETAGAGESFTVSAIDPYGNLAAGYVGMVTFSSTDPQAILPGSYTFTTSDDGKHTFAATLKTVGTQSITVTDRFGPDQYRVGDRREGGRGHDADSHRLSHQRHGGHGGQRRR